MNLLLHLLLRCSVIAIPICLVVLICKYKSYLTKTNFRLGMSYVSFKLSSSLPRLSTTSLSKLEVPHPPRIAVLQYEYLGRTYKLNIPYSRRMASSLSGHQAFLIKDGQRIDITQQSGVPYLVSASDLGGSEIIIEHNEKVYQFVNNEIPKVY